MLSQVKKCDIEDCEKKMIARGWCDTHYKRWQKHGDPLIKEVERPKRLCSIENCDRPHLGRGWCSMHYARWQKTGDPNSKGSRPYNMSKKEFVEWILSKKIVQPDGCWVQNELKPAADGYIKITFSGKALSAHRIIVEIISGDLSGNIVVHHKCHNRGCINPNHLQPVTPEENHAEMFEYQMYMDRIAELKTLIAQGQQRIAELKKEQKDVR